MEGVAKDDQRLLIMLFIEVIITLPHVVAGSSEIIAVDSHTRV